MYLRKNRSNCLLHNRLCLSHSLCKCCNLLILQSCVAVRLLPDLPKQPLGLSISHSQSRAMADIDQVKDKNHEGDNMPSHVAPKVLMVHKRKTDKKEKGPRKIPKKAAGQRLDVGWQHVTAVDNKFTKIKCNYCNIEYSCGISRFKHHLAGTHKSIAACGAVPNEVRQQMFDNVNKLQINLIENRTPSEDVKENEANDKLMTSILDKLEGIGGGPFTKALKILKEDPLWRDVFLALSDDRKKDFVLNL